MTFFSTERISAASSQSEIKEAFRKLAFKYHPDTTSLKNRKTAEDIFKLVNNDYEHLKNGRFYMVDFSVPPEEQPSQYTRSRNRPSQPSYTHYRNTHRHYSQPSPPPPNPPSRESLEPVCVSPLFKFCFFMGCVVFAFMIFSGQIQFAQFPQTQSGYQKTEYNPENYGVNYQSYHSQRGSRPGHWMAP